MITKGHKKPCGCVVGYYWCAAHDIYHVQDGRTDNRTNSEHEYDRYAATGTLSDSDPDCCSCHISAPCSYCTRETEDE